MAERAKGEDSIAPLAKLPHVMFFGGGVVIKLGDEVIGSIGAAGAPGAKLDDGCAKRGSTKSAIASSEADAAQFRRVASNRNHTRRSAWSIQFSSRLAVATSPCSSQSPCVSRMLAASCLLSSRSSASMSSAVT